MVKRTRLTVALYVRVSLACPTLRRMHEQYKTGTCHSVPEYIAFPHEFAKHFLLTVHFYGRRLYENQNVPKYLHYARIWNVYNDPLYFVRIANIKFYQNLSGDC
jgi:hypothetical protein